MIQLKIWDYLLIFVESLPFIGWGLIIYPLECQSPFGSFTP